MKKKIAAVLFCGVIAVGMIGCGSSSTEEEEVTEAVETLSPDEYIETAYNYFYEANSQAYDITTLSEYMIDYWEAGYSQDDCLENGYKLLEENDGITESDITRGTNTINALYQQLQAPPDDYQEALGEVIVPFHDSYETYYSIIMDGPAGYASLDDFADAFSEASTNLLDAGQTFMDYFSIGDETSEEQSSEVTSNEPVVYDIMNGLGTDVIGAYSVLEIPQSEATIEFLTDWYENYIIPSEHNYDVIIYSDRDDGLGVFALTSVETDVYIVPNDSGGYTSGGNSPTTVYYEWKDGGLVEYYNAADENAAQGMTAEEAAEEYAASGDAYPARWDFMDELEYEGYTAEEAEAAVETLDWNEYAVEDLQLWYDVSGNVDDAVGTLRSDDYTDEEIQHALDQLGLG